MQGYSSTGLEDEIVSLLPDIQRLAARYARMQSWIELDDLVGIGSLRMVVAAGRIRESGNVRGYLYISARNAMRKALRRCMGRPVKIKQSGWVLDEVLAAEGADPFLSVADYDVYALVAQLRCDYRELVMRHVGLGSYEPQTYEEIARAMGFSRGMVEARMATAYRYLRVMVREGC